MWFWWFMLCCDLFIPVMMILCGRMIWKNVPKNRNGLIGYRTTRARKNVETWKFAREYFEKILWKIGWITCIPSILIPLVFFKTTNSVIGNVGGMLLTIQTILIIGAIFPTERALKKTFTEEGVRRRKNDYKTN